MTQPQPWPAAVQSGILAEAWVRAQARRAAESIPPVWVPQDGPQAFALDSDADVIGYGGAAGGGKSDMLIGRAGLKHRRSLILRREFPRVRALIERSREIFNRNNDPRGKDSYNESTHVWRIVGGRQIEFGAVQYEKDKNKYQGQPHDLLAFDEVTEFPKSIVMFLMAWNRTTTPGQKCQTVMTFNPPMDDVGEWVIQYFAPWLDRDYPHPAVDGEFRWYAMIDGSEREIENGDPIDNKGEIIIPRSRTFFHASLKDNPILERTGYGAAIDALPEPLRSLLRGNFDAARTPNPYQTIPTDWIRQAVQRWRDTPHPRTQQTAQGVDVARGGRDQTVIAERYGRWVAELKKYPGASTPDGQSVAELVLAAMIGTPTVNIDVIGIGSSAYDHAAAIARAVPVNFGEGTSYTDKSGKLKFGNVRAAAYWRMRELLDPANELGVCLPDDPELIADLSAPRWELRHGGRVYIESKEDIIDRLDRSPDCGDAVVLAFWGEDALPIGITDRANPRTASTFARQERADYAQHADELAGGRFGRDRHTEYRRR